MGGKDLPKLFGISKLNHGSHADQGSHPLADTFMDKHRGTQVDPSYLEAESWQPC